MQRAGGEAGGARVNAPDAQRAGRVSGRVVLMAHSEREVRIHELVIEGELSADQSALETIWVAAQLEGLGF